MGLIKLPHGPWKSLLIGKYEDRDVSIYQNPHRDILYVVVDRDQSGVAKGLVVTVYRAFYIENGDARRMIEHLSGMPVAVVKKWKGDTFQFFLIPAGIKYISPEPEELKKVVDEMVISLDRIERNVVMLGRTLGMQVKPLAMVNKSVAAILFVEPTVIAGLSPIKPSEKKEGVMILGRMRTGALASESPINLRRTVIYGNDVGRKHMFVVSIEEFLRNGINVLLVTREPKKYEGFRAASEDKELLAPYGLQPTGFSLEVLEWKVDLGVTPPGAVVYTGGIREGTQTFNKAVDILKKLKPDNLLSLDTEEGDVISRRAVRSLRSIGRKGNYFDKVGFGKFVSLSSTGLGGLYIIRVENPWNYLSLLSYVSGIGTYLERKGKTEYVRVMVAVEDAWRILPKEGNYLTKTLVTLLERFKDHGMGWVLETDRDTNLDGMILALTETKLGAIGENDVGVRILTKRPYRMDIRPFITGVRLPSAPLASAPQAPPLDRK